MHVVRHSKAVYFFSHTSACMTNVYGNSIQAPLTVTVEPTMSKSLASWESGSILKVIQYIIIYIISLYNFGCFLMLSCSNCTSRNTTDIEA